MSTRPAPALLAATLLVLAGCKSNPKADHADRADPFVGRWVAVSSESHYAEDVDSLTLILDKDGFVMATLAATDEDDEQESYAITGKWAQATDRRFDAEFEFDEEVFTAHSWLTGPDTMSATLIAPGDEPMSITVEFERDAAE